MRFKSDRQRKAVMASMHDGKKTSSNTPSGYSTMSNEEMKKKGFLEKIKDIREEHRQKVQKKLEDNRKKEEAELEKLQAELKDKQTHQALENAKRKQILDQKKQIESLKDEERKTKAELEQYTAKGKIKAFLRNTGNRINDASHSKKAHSIRRQLGLTSSPKRKHHAKPMKHTRHKAKRKKVNNSPFGF